MVVAAILMILLTLLSSSLKSVQSKAHLVDCSAKMRVLGVGMFSYCADNNDLTPNSWNVMKDFHSPGHYIFRNLWRTYILPDYMGGDTKGGAEKFLSKTGWSLEECREWNKSNVMSCSETIEDWGRGDLENVSWYAGTGTMALNVELVGWGSGDHYVDHLNKIERPDLFAMGFCSSTGWRGNRQTQHKGAYDLTKSGYAASVGAGPVPLFPHGGKTWEWWNQRDNNIYFLDGTANVVKGDGHVSPMMVQDMPGGVVQARRDLTEGSRHFWFGYGEDLGGSWD